MKTPLPVGLELYSVRNTLKDDLEGTLEKVKSYGYDAVEFAGEPIFEAGRVAAALKNSGLWVSSWHVPYNSLLCDEETFKKTVEYHMTAGNKYLVIPWMPDDWMNSADALKLTAEKLNALCEKLSAFGLHTGYHNHTAEFKPLGDTGKTTWSYLRELTCDKFLMQLDTGNAMAGGADVNAELLAAAGRSQIIHLKPYSKEKGFATMIGEDDIDYPTIMNFCKTDGKTLLYVIEYECESLYSDMEGARLCVKQLREKYGNLL